MRTFLYTILARPPRVRPFISLGIGLCLLPLALLAASDQSSEGRFVAAGLCGGGIACLLMSAWDAGRACVVRWWDSRRETFPTEIDQV